MKASDRTARTLNSSDHIARPPCGPKSWYLHHLEPSAAAASASVLDIARSKKQLDMNYAALAQLACGLRLRGIRIDLSSFFLVVYR